MIGQLLSNRYELTQELGTDPVFTSYRAKDRTTAREVLVRVVEPSLASEAPFIAALKGVVDKIVPLQQGTLERVYGMDRYNGSVFIVSEPLAGSSMEDRLRRLAALSVPVAVAVAVEVCEALVPLHQSGIVHGDISARTIYSTPADGVKVSLPGFWEAYGHSNRAAIGMIKLMAPYLAPEISAGGMPTPASDVYALGCLIWQMLTGRLPYQGDSPAALAAKHSSSPYPSLRNVSASVPVVLDEVVRKAMEKSPLQRYANAGMMLADLKLLLEGLRFGRTLTWPLRPVEATPAAPVAPKLNAVKDSNRPRQAAVNPRTDRDGVPGVAKFFAYILGMGAITMLAAWVSYLRRPPTVQVPNLIGKTEVEARRQLNAMGVKMRISKRVPSDKFADGVVVQMSPAPGEDVMSRTRVEVVLSTGSEYVVLPDLRNKTPDDARKLLDTLGLKAASDVDYVHDDIIPDGKVAAQLPAAKTKVRRDATVKLRISNSDSNIENDQGLGPTMGLHHYTLRFKMPKSDSDIRVKVQMQDLRGTKTVHDETQSGNEKVAVEADGYGDSVRFFIYFDDVLKVTRTVKAS